MAEVIEVEIEQASEQEQRGREDEVVSVLSRPRPPVASDLSRKRILVTNPGKGNEDQSQVRPIQLQRKASQNQSQLKTEPKNSKMSHSPHRRTGDFFARLVVS